MAGQVHGLASYPPLHAVCARKDAGAAKVRPIIGRVSKIPYLKYDACNVSVHVHKMKMLQ